MLHNPLSLVISTVQYDHLEFPGVVPRTFLGAALLAAACSPVVALLELGYGTSGCDVVADSSSGIGDGGRCWQQHKVQLFLLVRCVFSLAWSFTMWQLQRAARRALGRSESLCLVVLTLAQFHLPFYASRPLPNSFAMLLVHLSYAALLSGNARAFIFRLAVATAAFRCDLLPLLGISGLWILLSRKEKPVAAISYGIAGYGP